MLWNVVFSHQAYDQAYVNWDSKLKMGPIVPYG